MKKIIAAAAGLMMVGVMVSSASAVENKFGGYWRTRMYTQIDQTGTDDGSFSQVDTRTRLYYTAIFNENFKFVNKFEMDAVWGEAKSGAHYGDIGADGVAVEVKNSYADFKVGPAQFKVGVQGFSLARSILLDAGTDASGVTAIFDAGSIKIPVLWVKPGENEADTALVDVEETDIYGIAPIISAGDGVTIQPYLAYAKQEGTDTNVYWAGADVDVKMDAASFWGTAIYNFGELLDSDVSAFLVAGGATAGPVHGMAFYSSGDDDPFDGDTETFVNTGLMSYYWSEIMGLGVFDLGRAAGPKDKIQNVWAANVGFKVKPADKLTLTGDVWYAALAEDDAAGETELGLEFDVKATYAIYDNLNLDLIAAYLIAGDAYGTEDPIELGARLSLSF